MKKIFLLAALCAFCSCGESAESGTENATPVPDPAPQEQEEEISIPSFVKGADISWATEMEAGGRRFKKKDGSVASLPDVLKDCGFEAVRLRVWVDPYKGWSGQEDVVAMAVRAQAAGLLVMIDFHYSDFFADPSRQLIPAAWKADQANLGKMAQHVSDHTSTVLKALQAAGVKVSWIQIGNETRSGMISPTGDLNYQKKGAEFTSFVSLYNAGYDAAKAVYPDALVMPHLNNAFDASNNAWWLGQFKAQGGKMDMVALSHYPQAESKLTATEVNSQALSYIRSAISTLGVPVMIAEVGVKSQEDEATAKSVLQSFVDQARAISGCAGVFYWEPEVDGVWKPEIYNNPTLLSQYTGTRQSGTWGAYPMGAFSTDGQPLSVLDVFAE